MLNAFGNKMKRSYVIKKWFSR